MSEDKKKVNKHYKSNMITESKDKSERKLEEADHPINISKQEKQGLLSHDNEEKQETPSSPSSSVKSPKEIEFNNRHPRVSDLNIGPDKVLDLEHAIKSQPPSLKNFPCGKMFKNPGILVMYIIYYNNILDL